MAEVRDQNARVMAGATVTWSSGDTSVATVGASGLVTGVAEGTATIMASAGSGSGMAEVTVTDSDRAALVAFYEATDGPNWVNSENWLTAAPLGAWFGVETDTSGRVVRLAMSYHDPQLDQWFSNNASGPVPPELGDLTAMRYLQFNNNRLSGSIPPELGKLTNLVDLDFNSNDLTGPIPPELGSLSSLEHLLLNGNDLSGPTPPELGDLASLTLLWLQGNGLEGTIPESFLDLGALRDFQFDRNSDLCVPVTIDFVTWLEGIERTSGPYCVAEVVIEPARAWGLAVGTEVQFEAVGRDADGNALDGLTFTWTSDSEAVATVSPSGLMTAVDTGEARITASAGTAGASVFVRVNDPHEPVPDPYPIRIHWGQCPQRNGLDGCVSVSDAREVYGDMIVDATEDVVAEWSRVLHPTPRTSWVAPVNGWDTLWPDPAPPDLWGIVPGDTVPPGLDMFVAGVTDEAGCGRTCATGHPVIPPGGHVGGLVRMVKVLVDSRFSDPGDQRWVTLHETGHAIAMSGLGLHEWADHIVKLPLSSAQQQVLKSDSIYVQTHPDIIGIYRQHGGGRWNWIGKGIGVAMDPHGNSHWNECSAPQDMMGPWHFYPDFEGTPRVRSWLGPLTATAARIHGGFEVDMTQVRPANFHIPHYWSGSGPDKCLILAR